MSDINKTSRSILGFTLAEVLITITAIGVVAAITLPVITPMIQERVDSYRHANIVHKITRATDTMKSLGMLGKFSSTDEFVDVLERYLKISKRCDSEHLIECWPTAKVTNSNGKLVDISEMKTRTDLGFKLLSNENNSNNVGIVLNDGAAIILTYSSANDGLEPTEATVAKSTTLPIGGGRKEFMEFTTNSTAGLAFLTDVNGAKGPNSETLNKRYHDIRSFNNATFGGCGGIKSDGICYAKIDSYSAIDCSRTGANPDGSGGTLNSPQNAEYCGSKSTYSDDKWAGAMKACKERGMELPNINTLKSICETKLDVLGLPKSWMWYSQTLYNAYASTHVQYVWFSDCAIGMGNNGRRIDGGVVCIN